MRARAYIGIGSNLDPERNVRAALHELRMRARLVALSTLYRTEPLFEQDAPRYINGVVAIETDLSPEALDRDLLRPLEASLGRVRSEDRNAPRTLDLDLLLDVPEGGQAERCATRDITERAFVAHPLAEIAPSLTLPDGRSILSIARTLSTAGMEPLLSLTAELRASLLIPR